MRRPRRRNQSLVYALYVNAALLLAILVLLLTRVGPGPSAAMAAPQMPPIAGGGGLYLMPAQFSLNTWGCYLLDIDAQTLCAYQYLPSQNQLRLVAARHFRHDRLLKNYNTGPNPKEIQHLIDLEKAGLRGQEQNGANGDGQRNDAAPPPDPAGGGVGVPGTTPPPQGEGADPEPGSRS
jgi:hypothetical protein